MDIEKLVKSLRVVIKPNMLSISKSLTPMFSLAKQEFIR